MRRYFKLLFLIIVVQMLAAYQQNVFAQLTGYTSRLKAQVNSWKNSGEKPRGIPHGELGEVGN